jgi:Flp pilus assembly protein TadD
MRFVSLAFTLLVVSTISLAAGSSSSTKQEQPGYASFQKGQRAVKSGDFPQALGHFESALAEDAKNPDYHNMYAYSLRHLERNDEALQHYQQALALKPRHLGANEYIGELYLKLGNLTKAEEHLKVLDQACYFGCEEYDELKEKIEQYKRRNT